MITVIGKHRVQHGNVMDGIDKLMQGEKADVMYSDPPWGKGNLAYWQTINNRHTGAPKQDVDLDKFLDQIFTIASTYVTGAVLIEYGQAWSKQLIDKAATFGLIHQGIAKPNYKSGSIELPLDLHLFGKKGFDLPEEWSDSIRGTTGMTTLRKAIQPFAKPGGVILDACCGMGYTARIAVETGMTFRGNELNSKRLQKTIDFLQSKTK